MNRRLKQFLAIFVVLILAFVGLQIKQSLTFHLVKTDPPSGSKPNQYTAVTFYFNQAIQSSAPDLNQVSISPSVEGKTSVTTKSVRFVPDSSFDAAIKYTAVLSGVKNTKGQLLRQISMSFTPQYIEYAKLPKDIQQRLIKQTDINDSQQTPYSANVIAIKGVSDLQNHGVTPQQIKNLQTAFFNFFISQHLEVRGMTLSNIQKVPHDRYSASQIDTINFTAILDDKTSYNAQLDYSNLTTVRLLLLDSKSGSQIFDSGNIGS